jgi:hypothetical protein
MKGKKRKQVILFFYEGGKTRSSRDQEASFTILISLMIKPRHHRGCRGGKTVTGKVMDS